MAHVDATPCPAPGKSRLSRAFQTDRPPSLSPLATAYKYSQDDTAADLDYTTELQARLRHVKPRRPRRNARKAACEPAIDIFEDVARECEQDEQGASESCKPESAVAPPRADGPKRNTILAHPAQKVPVAAAASAAEFKPARPARTCASQLLKNHLALDESATVKLQEDVLGKDAEGEFIKNPRRRTIYIPSEDTTIQTIHPGAPRCNQINTHARGPASRFGQAALQDGQQVNPAVASQQRQKPHRKSLAAPPKRGPLQESGRPRQGNFLSSDVMGKGGGKENIPPGVLVDEAGKPKASFGDLHANKSTLSGAQRPRVDFDLRKPVLEAKSGCRKRFLLDSNCSVPSKSVKSKADAFVARQPAGRQHDSAKPLSSSQVPTDESRSAPLRRSQPEQALLKPEIPHSTQKGRNALQTYPVLGEDLSRPELYEDHWLSHQEVALTQLLNSLFASAGAAPNCDAGSDGLRRKFLRLYQGPSMPLLHKRLQASLMYGALNAPKQYSAQTLQLKDDVGLRRKFLNLWVNEYDLVALRAAVETVVGRQMTAPSTLSSGSSGSSGSDDGAPAIRSEKKTIEAFLDAFLVRNEDAVRPTRGTGAGASVARGVHTDDIGSDGWAWRRTVLRSLMLILVLDMAKTEDVLSECLFQPGSTHKSSTDVLLALASLLLPSLGDIIRPLGHLNYRVHHIQHPLQEYVFRIENLATDLRNGVILTRLVELLLYPPPSRSTQDDEAVIVTLPSTDADGSKSHANLQGSSTLSQSLKVPCLGHAQKLHNVQIALSALRDVKGAASQVLEDIKADDIVDGHREKTLGLLWFLVGKWGLGTLVVWSQVEKEIARSKATWHLEETNYNPDLDSDDDSSADELEGFDHHKHLLLSWARGTGRLRGIRVSNMTTSFSDGRALEAVVDAYLPPDRLPMPPKRCKATLAMKLKACGCSEAFISLFASGVGATIPSQDFTVLVLAFLASRLLPLSQTYRAATSIQRAYRARLARQAVHRRVVLMRLARDAAAVVRERKALADAAVVLQRTWRKVLDAKREQLRRDVEAFQALARGWVIRTWLRRVTGGRIGGKLKERRVMGGW